jgi:hypothetical protein
MKLYAKRVYYLLLGGIGLSLVVVMGGLYIADKILEGQSKHLSDARVANMVLDEKQQQLSKARSDITKYQSLGDIAASIVPQDKDQAQTVRELVAIADANHIKLGTITFPSSSLGGTTGTATSGKSSATSQLKAVKNIPGVYTLDITIQSDTATPAKYTDFLSFLDTLEHNRRTALVNSISLQPDALNPSTLTFTLTVSEYIKP